MSAQPITKDDLDHAIEQSEARLTQRIADASQATADHTDRAVEQSEARLIQRIADASQAAADHTDRAVEQSEARLIQRIAAASEHTAQVTINYTDRAVQAVRSEIHQSEARLRGEIEQSESRLMQRIAEASEHTVRVMATRIGDELAERMGRELARHVQASDERNLDAIRSIDDQYRSLPGDVVALRDDLEAHASDDSRHLGPAPRTGGVGDTER